MLRSPLFRRFLLPIVVVILLFTSAVYSFSVPYLRRLVYSMEERSVLTNLNNVYELVRANYLAIEAYKESVTSAHKRQLKNITVFEEAFIKSKYDQFRAGLLTEEEAQQQAIEELKKFRYGNDNYVWIADIGGRFLSHPDPEMDGQDFSEVRDVFGNYVLTPLIDKALQQNEAYHSYWWQRLGQDLPAEQLSYARLFPQWGWIIGTGVYLDDLETEVIMRREKMIEELRQVLSPIHVAKTGHMYVFDSWQNIIIHPEEELINANLDNEINPSTGKPLLEDLMAASGSDSHRLDYLWDAPGDEGHFVHPKMDWVKYVEGFDWYIAASVYTEELNASSMELRDRIIVVSLALFLVTSLVIVLLVGKLLRPIRDLTRTASRVQKGDLNARSDIRSRDEIGFLAESFNDMVGQLRENIEELDQKVLERTQELDEKNSRLEVEVAQRKKMQEAVVEANAKLTSWVERLEQHNKEVTLLNRMGEMLQASKDLEETYPVAATTMADLLPGAAGALFMLHEGREQLEKVAQWNGYPDGPELLPLDDCWAIRRNRTHVVRPDHAGDLCKHTIRSEGRLLSFCLPLVGQNEILGMLHLRFDLEKPGNFVMNDEDINGRLRLVTAVADHLSMAQANLRLRQRLHHLSVRDGLTGLFNRRYMEETMLREFKRAERQGHETGVIILDVDFFKKFNDTWGHEAGDVVLKRLAQRFQEKVRQEDIVCRYGGEEFVIILPGSSLEQTVERAEEIRHSVENDLHIKYGGHEFKVTISMGAASYPRHGRVSDDILKAADAALYRAKETGRNRVMAAAENA
ncbi:MAG: diguanylate cyclase [Thermodesulfobacteriota bacterium]